VSQKAPRIAQRDARSRKDTSIGISCRLGFQIVVGRPEWNNTAKFWASATAMACPMMTRMTIFTPPPMTASKSNGLQRCSHYCIEVADREKAIWKYRACSAVNNHSGDTAFRVQDWTTTCPCKQRVANAGQARTADRSLLHNMGIGLQGLVTEAVPIRKSHHRYRVSVGNNSCRFAQYGARANGCLKYGEVEGRVPPVGRDRDFIVRSTAANQRA